ncbi:MAG: DNA-binding protein [candidate division WS1 bacterium]|jgi:predicted DNA-binding protein with PD1-like motif|nr:DNA-binding protein [candidate division WS1 bacterium]
MERFISDDRGTIVVRLDHGDLLLESLQQVADDEALDTAAIVTGFGALQRTHVHVGEWCELPPKNRYIVHEGPMELCSLTGLIAGGSVHAHITASDCDTTIAGHLEPETIVLYLTEIVLQVLPISLRREMSPDALPLLRSGS